VERRGAVKALRTLLVLLAFSVCGAAHADNSVALIVSAQSPVTHLNSLEIRKLFLGFSVFRGGQTLRALRNSSEPRIKQVFLQNVVAMSESTYERRMLSIALQQGQSRPLEYTDRNALLDAVAHDPNAVSIAFAADVAGNPHIKILRVVWHD
jgi:hypothetical protein